MTKTQDPRLPLGAYHLGDEGKGFDRLLPSLG